MPVTKVTAMLSKRLALAKAGSAPTTDKTSMTMITPTIGSHNLR